MCNIFAINVWFPHFHNSSSTFTGWFGHTHKRHNWNYIYCNLHPTVDYNESHADVSRSLRISRQRWSQFEQLSTLNLDIKINSAPNYKLSRNPTTWWTLKNCVTSESWPCTFVPCRGGIERVTLQQIRWRWNSLITHTSHEFAFRNTSCNFQWFLTKRGL